VQTAIPLDIIQIADKTWFQKQDYQLFLVKRTRISFPEQAVHITIPDVRIWDPTFYSGKRPKRKNASIKYIENFSKNN
jgi:hypothetical protein